jgi:hypothetical protein
MERKMTTELTYLAKIEKALSRLGKNGTESPDGSNTGTYLSDYFLWSTVAKYAEKKLEEAEHTLNEAGLIDKDPTKLPPGNHILAESTNFVLSADVTKPISRFDKDVLAENLENSKYHIPRALTMDFVNKSKKEGNPRVTRKIAER